MFEHTSCFRRDFPITASDAGRFFALTGTVTIVTKEKLLEVTRHYSCSSCSALVTVKADRSRFFTFPRSPSCSGCGCSRLHSSSRNALIVDYQEIRLTEVSVDRPLRSIPVLLSHDLVDTADPGQSVVITGSLFIRWRPFVKNTPIVPGLAFRANHVTTLLEVTDSLDPELGEKFQDYWASWSNPFRGRNSLLRSFCPDIFGMYLVKTALNITLAGGVSTETTGACTRGKSHLLLVGDASLSKSQLLKCVLKILPRSVYANGANVSNAGISAACVREGSDWVLVPGALVLASGAACCIDEFSAVSSKDQVAAYEAMEQQTVSITKAGIVSKLQCKTTVIAAANPKHLRFIDELPLEENIGLTVPLITRFDRMLILRDQASASYDEQLASLLLNGAPAVTETFWTLETLRNYFLLIQNRPAEMSEPTYRILTAYFNKMRRQASGVECRRSVRLLESLVRVAQGHSKLMFRDPPIVTIHDAVISCILLDLGMESVALWKVPCNVVHVQFPVDPLQEYYSQAEIVLTTLQLADVWETEKGYLANF